MYIEKEAGGEKRRSVFRAILVVKITKYFSLLLHLSHFPLPLD